MKSLEEIEIEGDASQSSKKIIRKYNKFYQNYQKASSRVRSCEQEYQEENSVDLNNLEDILFKYNSSKWEQNSRFFSIQNREKQTKILSRFDQIPTVSQMASVKTQNLCRMHYQNIAYFQNQNASILVNYFVQQSKEDNRNIPGFIEEQIKWKTETIQIQHQKLDNEKRKMKPINNQYREYKKKLKKKPIFKTKILQKNIFSVKA